MGIVVCTGCGKEFWASKPDDKLCKRCGFKPAEEVGSKVPRISDIVQSFEGDQVRTEDLVGLEMTVYAIEKLPSTFENQESFLVCQVKVDDVPLVLVTGGKVLMRKLIEVESKSGFPVRAKIVERKSGHSDQTYFDFE